MEIKMAWRLSTPSLSSFAWCKEVHMLQSATKTDLFHSLKYSDRWHFLGGSTLLKFFLKTYHCCSLAEVRIQYAKATGCCWCCPAGFLQCPAGIWQLSFGLSGLFVLWVRTVPACMVPDAVGLAFHCWKGNAISEISSKRSMLLL